MVYIFFKIVQSRGRNQVHDDEFETSVESRMMNLIIESHNSSDNILFEISEKDNVEKHLDMMEL